MAQTRSFHPLCLLRNPRARRGIPDFPWNTLAGGGFRERRNKDGWADLMCVAARTAPKAVGKDFIVTGVVEGDALRKLAEGMVEYGKTSGKIQL